MIDKHLHVWFVVFVVAVFLAGLGGGVIVDRYLGGVPKAAAAAGQPPFAGRGAGGPAPGMVMRRLVRDLDLSADQQAQLHKIFADRRQRIQGIQGEVRARFDTEQREMRQEIEKILTPEQRKRFEEWLAQEPLPGLRRGRGPGGFGRGMGPGRGIGR